MHILVAGFQHETNTFAPSKAGYDNFVRGEGFPAMVRGEAMLALRQVNIPAGGFINAVVAQGHTVRTVIWAAPARPPTSPPTPMSASPARSSRRRAKAATTPSTWTCTAPWSPSTWTTAKASCWRACARPSARPCPSSPAWTCTPTSPPRCWARPTAWPPSAPIRTWTWPTPASTPPACCWPASKPAPTGTAPSAACPS